VLFGRRDGLKNLYLVNNGDGTFWDASSLLPDLPGSRQDTTQEIEVCQLDTDADSEILVGNGDAWLWKPESNRALDRNPFTGRFADVAPALGFQFVDVAEITEDVECADLDGDHFDDTVLIGNAGRRDLLYRRQW
jgi:hypothetical protein